MEYTIDASNRILGRLATEVALLLRGKNDPKFSASRLTSNRVVVINTDNLRVTGKKMTQKVYRNHSGYPGGLRERTLEGVYKNDSREVLRHAVMGMLPKNRLRSKFIRNLILKKKEE